MTASPSLLARARVAFLTAGVVAAVLAIYLLRVDHVAGLIVDDAWYILLARSLARGERFGMVNSVFENGVTPYPPGFPLVLALVFRIVPEFPQNVWLLKSVSVAAMLGVGYLSYWYFTSQRGLTRQVALLCAIAVVATPAFVFLATSTVMSESVFTLVQLAVVVLLGARTEDRARRNTVLAGIAGAAALLIRWAGIVVIVAGVSYLVVGKQWRRVMLFVVTALVCVSPWLWYSGRHSPSAAERIAIGGGHALSYGQNFWLREASNATSGSATAAELPARVAENALLVAGRGMAALVVPTLFRGATESGMETIALGGAGSPGTMGSAAGTQLVSLALTLVAVIGFGVTLRQGATVAEFLVVLTLGMIVLWPFGPYRFLLPLAPFLVHYLVVGVQRLRPAPAVLRIALLSVVGLHLMDHVQYIVARQASATAWEKLGGDVDDVLDWMNAHLTEPGNVATSNQPLVYLRTGRKTIAIDRATLNRERWTQLSIRYAVYLDRVGLPSPSGRQRILHRSPRYGLAVVEH